KAPNQNRLGLALPPPAITEVSGARLDRLAILTVATRTIHIRIRVTDEQFPAFFCLGRICPPTGRHVFIRIFRRGRWRRYDRPFTAFASSDDQAKSHDP